MGIRRSREGPNWPVRRPGIWRRSGFSCLKASEKRHLEAYRRLLTGRNDSSQLTISRQQSLLTIQLTKISESPYDMQL